MPAQLTQPISSSSLKSLKIPPPLMEQRFCHSESSPEKWRLDDAATVGSGMEVELSFTVKLAAGSGSVLLSAGALGASSGAVVLEKSGEAGAVRLSSGRVVLDRSGGMGGDVRAAHEGGA